MELTPQLFRDVEFTERRGAYDKDEVHAFLARVGTAVGQLQERVREAQRRVEVAEEQLARARSVSSEQQDANETIQRTITMAARAAEEEIKQAKAQGETIVAEARDRADEMIVQAEEAVRRDVGATRDRLQAEIRDLERHRDELRQRIEVITGHLESERSRIHAELDELKAAVDDPDRLALAPLPGTDPEPLIVLSEEDRREPAPRDGAADDPDDEDLSQLPPPPANWRPGDPGPGERRVGGTDDAPLAFERGAEAPSTSALFDPIPPGDPSERIRPVDSDEVAGLFDSGGPPTEATPVIGGGTPFGGSHLDELRRAVSDDVDDSEADAAMAAFFDQDDDEERSRRFGRRR